MTILMCGKTVRVSYTNWRNETAIRTIELHGPVYWGATEWHPEPQWLVSGLDLDRGHYRVFAVAEMRPTDSPPRHPERLT